MPRHARPSWPTARSDARTDAFDERPLDPITTSRVREMVAWRGGFDASGVAVEVRGGTAILRGTLGSAADAEEARRLAASVTGVGDVQSRLRVRPARASTASPSGLRA